MDPSAFVSIMLAFIVLFIEVQPGFHDWRYHRHPDLILVNHAVPMPSALREDALLFTVTRDGTVFFENQMIVSDDLPGMIQAGLQRGSERKVYLRVAGRTRYSDVSIVLEEIKRTGLQEVCFLSQ